MENEIKLKGLFLCYSFICFMFYIASIGSDFRIIVIFANKQISLIVIHSYGIRKRNKDYT